MKQASAIILMLAILVAAQAEIQLHGVIKDGDAYLFSLSDTESKVASRWVPIGATFAGFSVVEYDAKKNLVRLKKGAIQAEAKLQPTPVKSENEAPIDIRTLSDSELASLGFYRIKPGDTMSKIARLLELTVADLVSLNPEIQPARLKVGQILVVPEPVPVPAP